MRKAITALTLAALAGCASSKETTEVAEPQAITRDYTCVMPKAMPRAVVYRTNIDVVQNVPVALAADGTIASFPATTDINENQLPIALDNGYLLDRRGIGERSVFTAYTYAQYAALATTPSVDELQKSIIDSAYVVEILRLPLLLSDATKERCDSLLSIRKDDEWVIFRRR